MNIIDAAKSGKPFKRKDWDFWNTENLIRHFSVEDILADDWVVKSELRKYYAWRNMNLDNRKYGTIAMSETKDLQPTSDIWVRFPSLDVTVDE